MKTTATATGWYVLGSDNEPDFVACYDDNRAPYAVEYVNGEINDIVCAFCFAKRHLQARGMLVQPL